jgi:hypothetical protein
MYYHNFRFSDSITIKPGGNYIPIFQYGKLWYKREQWLRFIDTNGIGYGKEAKLQMERIEKNVQ